MSKRTTLTLSTLITAVAFAIAWSFKGAKGRRGAGEPDRVNTPEPREEKAVAERSEAERMAADEDAGEAIEGTKVKLPRKRAKAAEHREPETDQQQ